MTLAALTFTGLTAAAHDDEARVMNALKGLNERICDIVRIHRLEPDELRYGSDWMCLIEIDGNRAKEKAPSSSFKHLIFGAMIQLGSSS